MKPKQIWEYSFYEIISLTMDDIFKEDNSTDFKFAVLAVQNMYEELNDEEKLFMENHKEKLVHLKRGNKNAYTIRSNAIKDSIDMMLGNYYQMPGRRKYQMLKEKNSK